MPIPVTQPQYVVSHPLKGVRRFCEPWARVARLTTRISEPAGATSWQDERTEEDINEDDEFDVGDGLEKKYIGP